MPVINSRKTSNSPHNIHGNTSVNTSYRYSLDTDTIYFSCVCTYVEYVCIYVQHLMSSVQWYILAFGWRNSYILIGIVRKYAFLFLKYSVNSGFPDSEIFIPVAEHPVASLNIFKIIEIPSVPSDIINN